MISIGLHDILGFSQNGLNEILIIGIAKDLTVIAGAHIENPTLPKDLSKLNQSRFSIFKMMERERGKDKIELIYFIFIHNAMDCLIEIWLFNIKTIELA